MNSSSPRVVPDPEIAVSNANVANNYLASIINAHPKRFRGFAALPLQSPEAAIQELTRYVEKLGFCGALVNDTTNGHYLDDPAFDPIWTSLDALGVPLYIHPGARIDSWSVLNGRPELGGALWEWQAQVGSRALRLHLSGVFDRHPAARIILGDMGEFLPFQITRFDSRYAAMKHKPQAPPSKHFEDNIVITTSGVFSPAALAGAVKAIGEDAILFAIDYSYEESVNVVEFVRTASLSQQA